MRSTGFAAFVLAAASAALGCAADASAPPAETGEEQQVALKRAYAIAISAESDPAAPAELNARWVGFVGVLDEPATRFFVQPCAVVASATGARPLVPDQVLQAVRPLEVSGRLDAESLEIDHAALLFGVRGLARPAFDPLPESAEDPRVYDHDGDGVPGFRLDGPSGPTNIGMRLVVGLRGSLDRASGQIQGKASIRVETRVYQASSYFAGSRGLDKERAESAERRFKLVPLPGVPTCRAAAALVGVEVPADSFD
jgi:hypothetical protein